MPFSTQSLFHPGPNVLRPHVFKGILRRPMFSDVQPMDRLQARVFAGGKTAVTAARLQIVLTLRVGTRQHNNCLFARRESTGTEQLRELRNSGRVPYWGACYKGILLLGVHFTFPNFVKPHMWATVASCRRQAVLQSGDVVVVHSLRFVVALLGCLCLAQEALHLPFWIIPGHKAKQMLYTDKGQSYDR